jgi:hypothetical protein
MPLKVQFIIFSGYSERNSVSLPLLEKALLPFEMKLRSQEKFRRPLGVREVENQRFYPVIIRSAVSIDLLDMLTMFIIHLDYFCKSR